MTVKAEDASDAERETPAADSHLGFAGAAGSGLLVGLLVLTTLKATFPLDNNDTWFHLAIGRRLIGDATIQDPGQLTSFATERWVPTQWSTQMVMAFVERSWGLPGIGWMFGLVYLGFVLASYAACRRLAGPVASAAATMVVLVGSFFVLTARPQSLSLVFLALTVFAWLGSVEDGRPRWWLVPMTWVWATAHGLWSVGLVVGGVCWLGLLAERRLARSQQVKLLGVLLASFAATLMTPLGPSLVTSQFAVAERSSLSSEWTATTFRDGPSIAVGLMLLAVVVLWTRSREQRWTRPFMFVLAAALLVYSVRFIGLSAVIVAPLFAEGLTRSTNRGRPRVPRAEVVVVVPVLLACLVVLGFVVPSTADEPANVPATLLDRLDALPEGTPILADTVLGGWIEYETPDLDPVTDGLFDAFSVPWLRDYSKALEVKPGWLEFVDRTGARIALLNKDTPLTGVLRDQLGWDEVARDGPWVYLEAPGTTPTR